MTALEARRRVRLPEEYRRFLVTVADGAAAPEDEVLLPIADALDGAEEALEAACPLTEDTDYWATWRVDPHCLRG